MHDKEILKLKLDLARVVLKNAENHILYDHTPDYNERLKDGFVKQEQLRNLIIEATDMGLDEEVKKAWKVFYHFQTVIGD